jgi:hypothetical protein
MSLAPKFLLTIFSDQLQKFVEFFDNRYRFVHTNKKLLQILALKFPRFGIAPVIFGLVPFQGKLFREPHEAGFAASHAHDGSFFGVSGAAPSAGGGSTVVAGAADGDPPILTSA